MNQKEKHGILHFWRYVEQGISTIEAGSVEDISDESLRMMKRIYRKLRILILKVEQAVILRKKLAGRITPKQVRTEQAKLRKKWL